MECGDNLCKKDFETLKCVKQMLIYFRIIDLFS